jgi:transketolase
VDLTPGVETTTGPLGQGLANAVGMALAEKLLSAEFNRPGHDIVDHNTYVFMGDGCLMEGISHEACALAGAWKLNKLIAIYDDNGISIDGQVAPWYIDDVRGRFVAYGWDVIDQVDGHDVDVIDAALAEARKSTTRPTLIICKTVIGKGSPNRAGTSKAHGEALGAEEIALTRQALGWDHPPFEVPAELYAAWDAKDAGARAEAEWTEAFNAYETSHPDLARELHRRMVGELPANFAEIAADAVAAAHDKAETVASRKASQIALEAFTAALPELLGGSADLTGSNLTNTKSTPALRFGDQGQVMTTEGKIGRHINYGVREFGMAAIMNGVALHGGFLPFGGTFLVFSDYMRNGLRLAALMGIRVIHVLTHDSVGVGEDGPTHQPIEHVASLRMIPGLDVWRPADTLESDAAWRFAVERQSGPSALIFSRQNTEQHPGIAGRGAQAARGGYVLADSEGAPQVVLIGTGSEVGLATGAKKLLAEKGISARVVSMPCVDVFLRQDQAYRDSVLPPGVKRVSVEAGVTDGWYRFVGADGAAVGIDRFGESAPGGVLYKLFGLTAEAVAAAAEKVLAK